jgi:hypothetical protein
MYFAFEAILCVPLCSFLGIPLRYCKLIVVLCLGNLGHVVSGDFAIAVVADISGQHWAFWSTLVMAALVIVGFFIRLRMRSWISCVSVEVQTGFAWTAEACVGSWFRWSRGALYAFAMLVGVFYGGAITVCSEIMCACTYDFYVFYAISVLAGASGAVD